MLLSSSNSRCTTGISVEDLWKHKCEVNIDFLTEHSRENIYLLIHTLSYNHCNVQSIIEVDNQKKHNSKMNGFIEQKIPSQYRTALSLYHDSLIVFETLL